MQFLLDVLVFNVWIPEGKEKMGVGGGSKCWSLKSLEVVSVEGEGPAAIMSTCLCVCTSMVRTQIQIFGGQDSCSHRQLQERAPAACHGAGYLLYVMP